MKIIVAVAILILVLAAVPLTLVVLSNETALTVDPPVKVIGFKTPVHIHAVNSHGVPAATTTLTSRGRPLLSSSRWKDTATGGARI